MVKVPNELKVKINISELVGTVEDLKDIKAKKNGEITVNELLRVLLNELNNNEIQELAVVRKYKNGSVSTGWTTTDAVEGLGLAEFLKIHIQDGIC
ncbi:hypothetical protein [Bacillus sp. S/N-304-OC-R1]|uniref:hypothetical protein n=1 Tax=Bacillus sp. S/N-304-OC-R1 TaxID=2758034 RepID=UPI001C8D60B5|nr:hypothetical protein [Bacillus sp. S/N-304-OC-R1]MBY0122177.1 hypothetical protein [Bacillus sp. S/N-304-OC-R1]